MNLAQEPVKMDIASTLSTVITSIAHSLTTASTKQPCHMMNHGGAGSMNHKMDHSSMKSSMDHDMPGMKMCKMSMTLNSDYENLCILTDKIMITSKTQLILGMLGIVLFTMFYEYFKLLVDQLQGKYGQYLQSNMVTSKERVKYKLRLSTAYALSVGYSFIIMLLFMTFNVWVMLSVCIGAGIGHYLCDKQTSSASLICH